MYRPVDAEPRKSKATELHDEDGSELLDDLDALKTPTWVTKETQEKLAKTFYYLVVIVLSLFLVYQAADPGRTAKTAWALASVAFHLVIPVNTMKLVPLDRFSVFAHFVLYYLSVVILMVVIIGFENVSDFFNGEYPPNLFLRIVIGIMGFFTLVFVGFLYDRYIVLWGCKTGLYRIMCTPRWKAKQEAPAQTLPLQNTDRTATAAV
ncbi:hypothetical protein BD410DRAFT_825559 [Rickenella mellea]|uniref:Uncharacterized protein n=1 Tax=Rickenella mellea TaxID=50990 RepID=A0A4Y7QIV0_9AGAM|nr:hypothetical protein BD410DRAFT_825559 [Rickenella mellea]